VEIEKFKVNRDFVWRFNNITVGTIKKDSIITILQKDCNNNSLLLSNGIGWVSNNSPIWNKLDIL